MQLPTGATVAVTDGEKFNLFRNAGDEADLKLTPLDHEALNAGDHQGSHPVAMAALPIPMAGRTRKTPFQPASSPFSTRGFWQVKFPTC